MASTQAPADTRTRLTWTGQGLAFEAGNDRATIRIESGPDRTGFSPLEALLTGLAGCMAVDVVMILNKMRKRVDSYDVTIEGWRVETNPRRFHRIRLTHRVAGDTERDAVERAVELSRTTYCSAMATLDPKVEIENVVEVTGA